MNILAVVLSYLLGAVPFGLLISTVAGKDVRQEGSKNIGATNVSRVLGKKLGALTLICDVLKAYLPMLAADLLLPVGPGKEQTVLLCGLAAVIGHIFPVYLGFKGGKGVASGLGMFLFLSPVTVLLALVVFVVAVYGSGFVSVGSLAASAAVLPLLWFFGANSATLVAALLVVALIWFKHHENIGRLLHGQEKSWKKSR